MTHQEFVSVGTNLSDDNQINIAKTAGDQERTGSLPADRSNDLPMLDYPVGRVFESQNGMGNIGLGSMIKLLVGLR